MMHILDATMLYGPGSGGVARYLRAKRAWLAQHAPLRHTMLVPGPRDGVGPYGEIFVRTRPLAGSPYRWPYDAARWMREICARRPDLIEAGDASAVGWMALMSARRLGVPLIAFCHSDIVRLVGERLTPAIGMAAAEYARAFYRRCDVVVVPSRYMQGRLASWGVEHAVVCPLGVDLRTFSPAARTADLRERLGLARRARVLVYAGRLAPEKNVEVLLEAFRLLGEPYHLVLAGAGAALPAQPNVTHLPFIESPRALAGLIASADALVHAGDQETFGLILLEAMACGRAVVAPAAGAVPELVDGDGGVLVAPRDPCALAAGIRAFYAEDCDARGARARERIERSYGWDAAMRRLLSVYRAALATAQRTLHGYAAP